MIIKGIEACRSETDSMGRVQITVLMRNIFYSFTICTVLKICFHLNNIIFEDIWNTK